MKANDLTDIINRECALADADALAGEVGLAARRLRDAQAFERLTTSLALETDEETDSAANDRAADRAALEQAFLEILAGNEPQETDNSVRGGAD